MMRPENKLLLQMLLLTFLGMLIGAGVMYGMSEDAKEENTVEMRTLKEMVMLADDLDEFTEKHRVLATQAGRHQTPSERQLSGEMNRAASRLRSIVLEDIKGR